MLSFLISLIALILGYAFYSRVAERVFAPDDRETPALARADKVDYIVMPGWRIFMIQFLNIAGTGPIFGAIMGMWFGPSAYLWIVFGCIFGGAVHDYISGMLSMRHDGCGQAELTGIYLGAHARRAMVVFTMLMMVLVGAFFVYCPAIILAGIWGEKMMWVAIIFLYYVATTYRQGHRTRLPRVRALHAFHGCGLRHRALHQTSRTPRSLGRSWQPGRRTLRSSATPLPCPFRHDSLWRRERFPRHAVADDGTMHEE